MDTTETNDATLVAESLNGSREAFRQIVERYQNLVCSLAYGTTGNVSQSEDVAQETFVAAWKDLRLLREPHKLRGWLCSIVRSRTYKSLRRDRREPVSDATALDEAQNVPAADALPSEQTISREEEAILWRSLEKIPEIYREPLVLFYRQQQSIQDVALALELSEDAVKQRLSRGRKLLQEEVQMFVEGALRRTAPNQSFSSTVMSALPLAAAPAATAGLGAGAKGAAAAKSGLLAACLMPIAGFLAGFASQWAIVRATTSEKERPAKYLQLIVSWIILLGIPVFGSLALQFLGDHLRWSQSGRFVAGAGFWGLWCMFLALWLVMGFRRETASRMRCDIPTPRMSPMAHFSLVAGCHFCIFSWVISMAWRMNDMLGTAILAGSMVILTVAGYLRLRGKQGVAVTKASYNQMAICCAVVLATVNLRLDVWFSANYGIGIAEIRRMYPLWIAPALTFTLAVWTGVLLALSKPSPAELGRQAQSSI